MDHSGSTVLHTDGVEDCHFNFHTDDTDCKPASEFLDRLHCLNLTQHIHFPTYTCGHTRDLVCSSGLTVHHLCSLNLNISDHLAITMDIDIPIPKDKLPLLPHPQPWIHSSMSTTSQEQPSFIQKIYCLSPPITPFFPLLTLSSIPSSHPGSLL